MSLSNTKTQTQSIDENGARLGVVFSLLIRHNRVNSYTNLINKTLCPLPSDSRSTSTQLGDFAATKSRQFGLGKSQRSRIEKNRLSHQICIAPELCLTFDTQLRISSSPSITIIFTSKSPIYTSI